MTDIDRAGAYEPWRGPNLYNVRIVKDIYPPRIDLRFEWTGARGDMLKSGERKLRDPAFLMTAGGFFANDPLRYEKVLLDDWMRRELVRPGP